MKSICHALFGKNVDLQERLTAWGTIITLLFVAVTIIISIIYPIKQQL